MTSTDCLVRDLRAHVHARGGPAKSNGAWQMMLDAADKIERLQQQAKLADEAMVRMNRRADRYQAVIVGIRSEMQHTLVLIDGMQDESD